MPAALIRPTVDASVSTALSPLSVTNRCPASPWLAIDRTDIAFADLLPGIVQIELTIRNVSSAASQRAEGVLESAPLGVFVPWRPLRTFSVPSIQPGGAAIVRIPARRPQAAQLTREQLTTPALLTALGLAPPKDPAGQLVATGNAGDLPAAIHDLFGAPALHWAGNLNVFIGRQPVERHRAMALRIYPGRQNLAAFIVGERVDQYTFELEGQAVAWGAELWSLGHVGAGRRPLERLPLGAAQKMAPGSVVLLSVVPPTLAEQGDVTVHVKQQSTGHTACVEFTLDPRAPGAGCFLV